jgi:hypothetical protein
MRFSLVRAATGKERTTTCSPTYNRPRKARIEEEKEQDQYLRVPLLWGSLVNEEGVDMVLTPTGSLHS